MRFEKKRLKFQSDSLREERTSTRSVKVAPNRLSNVRKLLMSKTLSYWEYIEHFNSVLKSDDLQKLLLGQDNERLMFWKQRLHPLKAFDMDPALAYTQEFFHSSKKSKDSELKAVEASKQRDQKQLDQENMKMRKRQLYYEIFERTFLEQSDCENFDKTKRVHTNSPSRNVEKKLSRRRNNLPKISVFTNESDVVGCHVPKFNISKKYSEFSSTTQHNFFHSRSNNSLSLGSKTKTAQGDLDGLLNSLNYKLVRPRGNFLLLRVAGDISEPIDPTKTIKPYKLNPKKSMISLDRLKQPRIDNILKCDNAYKIFMKKQSFVQSRSIDTNPKSKKTKHSVFKGDRS